MVYEEPKRGADFLPLLRWAYRTSKHTSTQATPFSLVYEAEPVVPIKITISIARLALASKISDPTVEFTTWKPSRKEGETQKENGNLSRTRSAEHIIRKLNFALLKLEIWY